jgi:hypothetical protein
MIYFEGKITLIKVASFQGDNFILTTGASRISTIDMLKPFQGKEVRITIDLVNPDDKEKGEKDA